MLLVGVLQLDARTSKPFGLRYAHYLNAELVVAHVDKCIVCLEDQFKAVVQLKTTILSLPHTAPKRV